MGKTVAATRASRRISLRVPVRLSTIDPEVDPVTRRRFFRALDDWSANLSRGGVFVRTQEPLAPGRRVWVELRLPDGDRFAGVGRVAWARRAQEMPQAPEAGVGIQFLAAEPEHVRAIDSLLRAAAPSAAPAS